MTVRRMILKPRPPRMMRRSTLRHAVGRHIIQPLRSSPVPPPRPDVLPLLLERGPRCRDVDDGVPHALEWQNHRTRHIQTVAHPLRIQHGMHTVDAARCPRDENRDGKDERRSEVGKLDGIEVVEFALELSEGSSDRTEDHPRLLGSSSF